MFFNKKNYDFSYGKNIKYIEKDIYTAHPFTNWSLNPNFKKNNIKEHLDEGFRKTSDVSSIFELLNNYKKSEKIYCMGGSSTYCTELYNYYKSWPFKLQKKINIEDFVIINGGVGGWGTFQSLIRFIGWANIIKPKILIIYQSKNDLTPFYNANESIRDISPLYQNVMLQYNKYNLKKYLIRKRIKYLKNFQLVKFYKSFFNIINDLGFIYSEDIYRNELGFKRFSKNFLDSTILNYEIIYNILSEWDGKILFIPELIDKESPYFKEMDNINKLTKERFLNKRNFIFFDISELIEINKNNFLDNMHYNESGCSLFSEIIYNKLKNLNLLK